MFKIKIRPYKNNKNLLEADMFLSSFGLGRKRVVVPGEYYLHVKSVEKQKKLAMEWAADHIEQLLQARKNGNIVDKNSGNQTLDQYFQHFMSLMINVQPGTLDAYTRNYKNHINPELGDTILKNINQEVVDSFLKRLSEKKCRAGGGKFKGSQKGYKRKERYTSRKLNNKTQNIIRNILNKVLERAHEDGLIEKRPRIKMLRVVDKVLEGYTEAQQGALVTAASGLGKRALVFLLLGLELGLRRGEIQALRWQCVDLERGLLRVELTAYRGVDKTPKGEKIRILPISKRLGEALEKLPRKNEYVLESKKYGGKLTDMAAQYLMRTITRAASQIEPGIKSGSQHIHILRHTAAQNLAEKTKDILLVSGFLGHSNLGTTQKYMGNPNMEKIRDVLDGE